MHNCNNLPISGNDINILREQAIEIINNMTTKLRHSVDYYLPDPEYNVLLKPAIAYIRYSDQKQDNNHSIEIQKYEINSRAKKEGYQIVLWCIDESVSATHNRAMERPWMQILYKVALLDQFEGAIFFYDDSRVSRQTTDFVREVYTPLITLKPFLKFICSDTQGIWDPNTPFTQVKLLLNREHSVNQKGRAISYQKKCLYPDKKEDFRRPGAKLPFGYVKGTETNPKIDISKGQAYIVFLIFYLSSWGYSNDVIAKFLNKCEILSPKMSSWSQGAIDKILHNYFYLGHTTWDVRKSRKKSNRKPLGQFSLFNDTHTGIIPPYLETLVNQVRNFKKIYGLQMDSEFLLKELVKCDKCNCKLEAKNTTSGKSKTSRRVYRCPECKNYVKIQEMHEIIFQKFFSLIIKNKTIMKEGSIKTLKKWVVQTKQIAEEIKNYKDLVVYQEKTFKYELIGYEKELKNETKQMLMDLDNQLKDINAFIDQINILLNDSELNFLFDRFFDSQIDTLSNVELRCLSLHFISEIRYDFNTNNTAINYSKTPFIDFEKWKSLFEQE
ncbi:recombinase family protein [Calidifontibacillus oryziterrae]|uniref:recombinase family protein n=1 Tax=Calidifontibacillus oryziterrae TaxID=1191699 RepID=UPI000302920F|nr:recombinase family protein [Calidifontibacillus oryziterrae]